MTKPLIIGQLYATNDPGLVTYAMTCGVQVIALVDTGEAQYYPGCNVLSSFLPPPDVISEMLDGDFATGIQKYKMYLASPQRESVVVSILGALHLTPKPYLFYTEFDPDREFHILETIMTFFREVFGIIIGWYGDRTRPFQFINSPQYVFTITDLLFVNNYIKDQDYAFLIPRDAIPSPRACSILLKDIQYGFRTQQDAIHVVMTILNNIRIQAHGQSGQINPLVFTHPCLPSNSLTELHDRRTEAQVYESGNVAQ